MAFSGAKKPSSGPCVKRFFHSAIITVYSQCYRLFGCSWRRGRYDGRNVPKFSVCTISICVSHPKCWCVKVLVAGYPSSAGHHGNPQDPTVETLAAAKLVQLIINLNFRWVG